MRTFRTQWIAMALYAAIAMQPAWADIAGTDGLGANPDSMIDASHARAVSCLATAIAYEAGYEPVLGQEAVAEVIINRARNPSFPKTICGVVFEGSTRRTGCQFSFTCDGSLRRRLPAAVMETATSVAQRVLAGNAMPQLQGATHYHADYVSPYWAPSLIRLGKIGRHIFYRVPAAGDVATNVAWKPVIDEPAVAALESGPVRARAITAAASPDHVAAFAPWGLPLPRP